MSTIPGYEVVVTKQAAIAVPPICAGCGGRIDVATLLRHNRLSLTVGLCHGCAEARVRARRGGLRLFGLALGAGSLVAIALFLAPPLPLAVFLAPPAAAVIAAVVLWPQLRSRLAATQNVWAASPYRSSRERVSPPTPIAITRVGAVEALVYCANEAWADEFSRANRFERRAPTKRPGLHDGVPLFLIAFMMVTGAAFAAWTYQWPEVLIDNGSLVPVVVWMDGRPRWTVPPKRGAAELLDVRVPRAAHRFAYQPRGADEPIGEIRAEPPGVLDWLTSHHFALGSTRTIYNPGALACYFNYDVEYGSHIGPREPFAEHLPQREWARVEVDDLFTRPPERVEGRSSQTRSVLVRDDLCTDLLGHGCAEAGVAAAKACFAAGGPEYESCARRAVSRCGRAADPRSPSPPPPAPAETP